MARDVESLLEYEIRKKPAVAAIAQRLDDMSKEDIDALKLPKWIKQAFWNRKLEQQISIQAEELSGRAIKNMIIKDSFSPEIYGEIRRWVGNDVFIKVDRGCSIELRCNKIVFFPTSGGVWLETVFSSHIDPRLYSTIPVEMGTTRSEYIIKGKAELAKLHPNAPVLLGPDVHGSSIPGSAMAGLAAFNVRTF
jgi:hypothetical protein